MLVLICEDDALVAQDLFDEVASAGLAAIGPARNTTEAMAAVDAHAIAIAVVDLILGDGRSGVAVARELHARGIAIIVSSGGDLSPEELADMDHMFLRKPMPPGALADCLRAAARRRAE